MNIEKESWLGDVPERILLVILLKGEVAREELIKDFKFQNEDLLRGSIARLLLNGLIESIPCRLKTGLEIKYRLTESGIEKIQQWTEEYKKKIGEKRGGS